MTRVKVFEIRICRGCDDPCILINTEKNIDCEYPQCMWETLVNHDLSNTHYKAIDPLKRALENIIGGIGDETDDQ